MHLNEIAAKNSITLIDQVQDQTHDERQSTRGQKNRSISRDSKK